MTEPEKPMSPELATAIRATERALAAMEAEFGLLDATAVAKLLGAHDAAELLVVQLSGEPRYPGFQFDQQARQVKPAIRELLELASSMGRTADGVALWLVGFTTYLGDGVRPVDLIDSEPERVLEAARNAWGAEW